jgi:hypothetical protein
MTYLDEKIEDILQVKIGKNLNKKKIKQKKPKFLFPLQKFPSN